MSVIYKATGEDIPGAKIKKKKSFLVFWKQILCVLGVFYAFCVMEFSVKEAISHCETGAEPVDTSHRFCLWIMMYLLVK